MGAVDHFMDGADLNDAPVAAVAVLPDTRVLPQLLATLAQLSWGAHPFTEWRERRQLPAFAIQLAQVQLVRDAAESVGVHIGSCVRSGQCAFVGLP